MKKITVIILLLISSRSEAQVTEIISIIKVAITKVIKAVDLEVQRMQTKTIWLQNAQKELENTMSKLKLDDITDWVQKQKDLYAEYYAELSQVKQIISDYNKVKKIIQLQSRIVLEYKSAYALFRQDKNFSSDELDYMYKVYSGILDESLKNVDEVLLVVNAFVTQTSDAQRLNIIDNAAKGIQKNYNDLRQFNDQNIQLSLQRSLENNDVETVKKLYGLP
jgi:hypothetical protein